VSTRSVLSPAASSSPRGGLARARARRRRRRRRISLILGVAGLTALLVLLVGPRIPDAVRELTLPLRHEDIIRQQSEAKQLDPSFVAAVIYAESKFRDQTSHAGARGLMQITPATARYIARLSGGTTFEQGDLATPQINISYGAYYLRYLLERYDGDVPLATAAYNAGETNVNAWVLAAGGEDEFDASDHVPFPETRQYVHDVAERRDQYRENYSEELGL